MKKIAYITAGDVGAGHVVRGLAIERGLARRGASVSFRMFGPQLAFSFVDRLPYQAVPFDVEALRDPERALESELFAELSRFRPDLLLVDLFWAPLLNLLPKLDVEAWLLIRRCPEVWLRGSTAMPFAPQQYSRIVAIEPLVHPLFTHRVAPIVVCNPEERRDARALRRHLGVGDSERLVVVAHAGIVGELEVLVGEPGAGGARCFDLHGADGLFPLAEWLHGADEIFCGGGYNSVWEAHALGYFERCRFRAFARSIDNQAWRIERAATKPLGGNGADELASWICVGLGV